MRRLARMALGHAWVLLAAIGHPLLAQSVVTIANNGDPANRVDLVIVAEGYTGAELAKFATDVSSFLSLIFAQEPLREYQRYFNVRRIDVASPESGADHPESNLYRNTAFDATYFCGGIDRLLCVDTGKVLNVVSILPPDQRDTIVVIVNDPTYGGAGYSNGIAVASTNSAVVELVLHEAGHSLGRLADEYADSPPPCDDSVEPFEANVTRETSRTAIKWGLWIDPATPVPTFTTAAGIPGLYQGAKYCPFTLYRPTYNSKMRSLGFPFEQINDEQLIRAFYTYVSPIDSVRPADSTVLLTKGVTTTFEVFTSSPATHNVDVIWTVDGAVKGNLPRFVLDSAGLPAGVHTVNATARDLTPMVRSDPSRLLVEASSWSVTVVGVAGDLNGDGHADCIDLAIVKASFGKQPGQPGFNPLADVNADGTVDVRDLQFVAQKLPAGTRCP